MTIKSRLAKLEKAIKPSKNNPKNPYSWVDYSRTFDTLAQAMTEITGQEATGAEIEKQLMKLNS